MIFDTVQVYAIAVGAFFAILLLERMYRCCKKSLAYVYRCCKKSLAYVYRCCKKSLAYVYRYCKKSLAYVYRLLLRYLVYPQLVSRHRFLGPWSRSDVLIQLVLVTANAFCLLFRAPSWREASQRAARLSLVNLAPAYGSPHLSFFADIFSLSLRKARLVHATAGSMALLLLAFHVAAVFVSHVPFPLRLARNMWGGVSASSLCLVALSSAPVARRVWHEVSVRLHQILAVACILAAWFHLEPEALFSRIGISALVAVFASVLLLQCAYLVYQNVHWNSVSGTWLSRAYLISDGDAVRVRLHLSRHLKIEAGQYIGLCIPAVGFWSSLQSHPFTVVRWENEEQTGLDLLVEPRSGWTRKLLELADADAKLRPAEVDINQLPSHLALFTGPHGRSVPVADYETVLLISSGFGICSQLPYLRLLLHSDNACKTRGRRIHVIWQPERQSKNRSIASELNAALSADTLDGSYKLTISIYVPSSEKCDISLGRRVELYCGSAPDLERILEEERKGVHIKQVQDETGKREGMAVLVSATGSIRDRVKELVRDRVKDGVDLFELEYQPV